MRKIGPMTDQTTAQPPASADGAQPPASDGAPQGSAWVFAAAPTAAAGAPPVTPPAAQPGTPPGTVLAPDANAGKVCVPCILGGIALALGLGFVLLDAFLGGQLMRGLLGFVLPPAPDPDRDAAGDDG